MSGKSNKIKREKNIVSLFLATQISLFLFFFLDEESGLAQSSANIVMPMVTNSAPQSNSLGPVPAPQSNSLGPVPAPLLPATQPASNPQNSLNSAGASQEEIVSVDFRQTPLGDVLRMLAESAQINLVIGKSVLQNQPVTLKLNDITYRTALSAVLGMFGLEAQTKNNIVKIESVEQALSDLELRQKLQSNEWENQPTRVLVWQLNYAQASEAQDLIAALVKSRFQGLKKFSISVDARMNKIVIESIPDVLERVKTLLKAIDGRRRQVLIEARIVEASKELSNTLGISWGARIGLDGQRGLSTGLLFPNSLIGNIGGAGNVGQTAPQPGTALDATRVGTTALSLGSINGLINLDAVLQAYETESMANIIASPRIVVEDQDSAKISESTSFRREIIAGNNIITTTTNLELSLDVKPKITNDGNVQMKIDVNRGTPASGSGANQVEGVTNRKASTNLSVADGETAVIGGLYQSSRVEGAGKIPILGDLPIIGFLFRTKGRTLVRTELMVMITPRILRNKETENAGSETLSNTEPVTNANTATNTSLNNVSEEPPLAISTNSFDNPEQSANNGQRSSNQGAGNEFSNNEFSNNEFSNNEFSNNEFSNNEFSNNEFSNNARENNLSTNNGANNSTNNGTNNGTNNEQNETTGNSFNNAQNENLSNSNF